MSEEKTAYDKLTPQRKLLVDAVMRNLQYGGSIWRQGWQNTGAPESAITGKRYRGVNSMFLTLAAIESGYTDNRWATFKQIEDKGWSFKKTDDGHSLGKGSGVAIEYFELRDRETKKPFDRSVLDGMDKHEREEYMKENVYPLRKYYRVFNGDVIEGIPAREIRVAEPNERIERVEQLFSYWNENEAQIRYGGDNAYYSPIFDRIQLPDREKFISENEHYSTGLHEMGHSTGHKDRLNRDLSGKFGSADYAVEELRAEIASMFLMQELGVAASESEIENNSAYIEHWMKAIKDDPDVLFTAIADADRISNYIIDKERAMRVEPFAIQYDETADGQKVYKLVMTAGHGQTRPPFPNAFVSREELMAELDKMKEMPFWKGKEFKEVTLDELQNISVERAQLDKKREEERIEEIKQEESTEYMLPSEIAARAIAPAVIIDMAGRGIESLTRMSDRDVVEKASKTRSGKMFDDLYNGKNVFVTEEANERALMRRIAMYSSDKEQLMRVFKSSGQYRDEKPNAFYEKMAMETMQFIENQKEPKAPASLFGNNGKGHFGLNSKT